MSGRNWRVQCCYKKAALRSCFLHHLISTLRSPPHHSSLSFHHSFVHFPNMHAFSRIAAFVFVLLSLSFLVSALPAAPRTLGSVCGVTGTDAVSAIIAKLAAEVEVKINALLGCGTKAELSAAIDVLVGLFKGCAEDLLKVGAGISITVEAKASIVACICSIITLLAKVCAQVSVKFGILVVLTLFA
ncbi:hypothetical protein FRC08_016952, partial [Ceratobasidium sp. 394]